MKTQYTRQSIGTLNNINFLLNVQTFGTFNGSFLNMSSTFFPDADLMRRDGEVSLSFLSGNGIYFTSPTDDDWYRANVSDGKIVLSINSDTQRRYRPQEAASPLGCIQQWQFCRDPARGQCGNLANRFDALYSAAPWFDLTSDDMESSRPIPKTRSGSLLLWLFFTLMETVTSLHGIITTLGPTSLASQAFLQSGTMMRIQQNQWHLDVERWWQMIMAGFQASFISTARGSGLSDTAKPENEQDWSFCHS
ncbi:hypothetical protein PG988_000230 [Apiospora saccharicola]